MLNWVSTLTKYLNKFLELGILLLAVSVIAEIVFGPNVAFFGSQVTKNLINLLNAYVSSSDSAPKHAANASLISSIQRSGQSHSGKSDVTTCKLTNARWWN